MVENMFECLNIWVSRFNMIHKTVILMMTCLTTPFNLYFCRPLRRFGLSWAARRVSSDTCCVWSTTSPYWTTYLVRYTSHCSCVQKIFMFIRFQIPGSLWPVYFWNNNKKPTFSIFSSKKWLISVVLTGNLWKRKNNLAFSCDRNNNDIYQIKFQ